MQCLRPTVEENHGEESGGNLMMYVLLAFAVGCIVGSLKFVGPPAWVLGILGIVLLISSYLWEVYRGK